VFIDGEAGTTGLQIRQRLAARSDLRLVSIDADQRKDPRARAQLMTQVDLVILCLPDAAAHEAIGLLDGLGQAAAHVRVIDASSAHRTAVGWTYGFPEMLKSQRSAIRGARRVSNPGCYPTGFLALVRPLVDAGLLPAATPVSVHAVSGYSGGGRALLEELERPAASGTADAFRSYGLSFAHKHLPEMQVYAGLDHAPLFSPAVARYNQGMWVEVPLHLWALPRSPKVEELRTTLSDAYAGEPFVSVANSAETEELEKQRAGALGYVPPLDPEALNGSNRLRLFVFGSDRLGQARLVAQLDNLGKGASGAAVQNLNLMLGIEETRGLL
jgi:N-acetyl-gamma-glutamyl-phosphate reductase